MYVCNGIIICDVICRKSDYLATDSVMAVITEEMRDDFTLHAGTRLSYAQIQSQKGSRKKGGCMFSV